MTETQRKSKKALSPTALYPWLRRDYFKTSVSYLISLGIHAVILLLLLATVVLDGGGGPGDSYGGKGEMFSLLSGHGRLDYETDRTHQSDSLLQEVAKQIEQIEPLPEVASEAVPELSEVGVHLASVAPRINPIAFASSLRNMPPASIGGGVALGPGVGAGGGLGGGIGRGFGRGFGDFIGLLHKWGFDAVFVIDATGSMQFVIDEVREKVTRLIERIQQLVPVARVGLVLYKDRDSLSEFVVRKSPLTFHGDKLRAILKGVAAEGGGGDWEEGVKEGLAAAVNEMSWRVRSRKIIVVVANSPPHPEDWPEIERLVAEFRHRGGIVSAVEAALPEFRDEVRRSLVRIAEPGGGEVVSLEDHESMMRALMVVAFGTEWEAQVAEYARD
ncbi:MAG: VWA domain-containing protein [Gemmatimonadetes bacterium]|nr:VWA domain-containing protein [Gemmatimonadota bacterium]